MQAAVTPLPDFKASTENVISGNPVNVEITTTNFVSLSAFQFSISWDTNVLTIDPVTPVINIAPSIQTGFSFAATNSSGEVTGQLGVLWSTAGSVTVADNTALFDMNFTSSAAAGTLSAITFTNFPTEILVTDVAFNDDIPTLVNGLVTVVPEPVNVALGLLGGVWALGSIWRGWRSRRRAIYSTRTR
jgi:hypothetical protein